MSIVIGLFGNCVQYALVEARFIDITSDMIDLIFRPLMVKYIFEIAKAFLISGVVAPVFTLQNLSPLETISSVSFGMFFSFWFAILAIYLQERIDHGF